MIGPVLCSNVEVLPCVEVDMGRAMTATIAREVEATLRRIGWLTNQHGSKRPQLVVITNLEDSALLDWLNIVARDIQQVESSEMFLATCMLVSADGTYCFGEDMSFRDAVKFASVLQRLEYESQCEVAARAYAGDWYRLHRGGAELIVDCVHYGHTTESFRFDYKQFEDTFQDALIQLGRVRERILSIIGREAESELRLRSLIEEAFRSS